MKHSVTINQKPESMIEILGSIGWEEVAEFKQKALDEAVVYTEVDGFRKGKAPRDKVEAVVGAMPLLSRAAELAFNHVYPEIVMENKLLVIGHPSVSITKLAEGNPLEFKVETAVFPEVTLGDYKAIAKKHNEKKEGVQVTEEEVQQSLERVRHMMLHQGDDSDEQNHDHDALPELTLDFVKTLGDFASIEEFTDKVRDNIKEQKEMEATGKRREQMIMELVEASTFDTPSVLVAAELEKMVAQMKDDITRMGLEFDNYLKHIKKSEEDLKVEWALDAKRRAQAEIVLKQIAKVEGITPDSERVKTQVEKIKAQYDDVDDTNIKLYVEGIFLNEAVLTFLDTQ